VRRTAALLLAVAGPAWPAAAQEPAVLFHHHPTALPGANTFLPQLGWRLHLQQRAPYEARVTTARELVLVATAGFDGSRSVSLTAWAPLLADGWRLKARAEAGRDARFGWFGTGNDTEDEDGLVTDATPYWYRVRHTRYAAGVEVTRRITGALHLAAGAGASRTEWRGLPGASLFEAGLPDGLDEDDATGRLALVWDSRDREYGGTRRGLLLEAGVLAGTGGDGYTRGWTSLRGWVPVGERTVMAGRVVAADLGGEPTLDARALLPVWEGELTVLGGPTSYRGADTPRWLGTGLLLANAEVRVDVFDRGDFGGVSLVAFADGGRVFEGEGLRLTLEDWHLAAGAGAVARLWRRNTVSLTVAGGGEGAEVLLGGGWMF
jgi:hypothetical protein